MTQTTKARAWRYVDVAGLWCALGYALLAFLARRPGEPDLPVFFLLVAWISLPVFGLYLYFRRCDEPFPFGRLIFWAVVFRICGLAGGPFFEDDFYRYLWDGYRFAATGTPYGAAPEAFFADPGVPAVFHRILDNINNPELPTIYAPVTQVVFLLGYWLKPGSVTALQLILVVVDLATIALLLRLAPAGNVMLYAWCPLVVKEIAFTAHPDGAGVCLLLAAIVLARDYRWWSAAVCLGMAVGAKVFALVLAPLVLVGAGFWPWVLFIVTLAALYAPFALQGGTGLESLLIFAREWEFNSAAFGLVTTVLQPFQAKLVLGLLCAAFWGHYYFRYSRNGAREVPRGDWLYGALLVASPVINPWYLLWVLPFAAITPSVSAWTASVAVLFAYVTGLHLNDGGLHPYQQPVWARVLEFSLILLALAWDLIRRRLPDLGGRVSR
ncbi:MAG: hypothetical protein OXF97_01115 [Nitrospira sp.]|nr:hypothetical protein [Nitrospira sp.]